MRSAAGALRSLRLCLFDLDYTLLRLTRDPISVHMDVLAANGIPVGRESLLEAYSLSWEQYLRRGHQYPTAREAYLEGAKDTLRRVNAPRQIDRMAEQIMSVYDGAEGVAPYADALPVLMLLRGQGVAVGVATGRWHDPAEDLRASGLLPHVDVSFFSGALHAQKDEPAYWLRLLELQGLDAAQAALIDDNAQAVETAAKVGLRTLLMLRPDSPLPALREPDLTTLESLPELLGLK